MGWIAGLGAAGVLWFASEILAQSGGSDVLEILSKGGSLAIVAGMVFLLVRGTFRLEREVKYRDQLLDECGKDRDRWRDQTFDLLEVQAQQARNVARLTDVTEKVVKASEPNDSG